jgi:hypothetical protein
VASAFWVNSDATAAQQDEKPKQSRSGGRRWASLSVQQPLLSSAACHFELFLRNHFSPEFSPEMSRSGSTGPNAEEKMVISLSEFTALQTQMLELKQARYEAIEREKKLSKGRLRSFSRLIRAHVLSELETLKAQAKHTEEQLKKAAGKSDFSRIFGLFTLCADQINKARESRIENENLKKALEQLRAEAQQNQGEANSFSHPFFRLLDCNLMTISLVFTVVIN